MRQTRLLQLSALLLMLSSCADTYDVVYEKVTGERSLEMVAGPRRAPKLNPAHYVKPNADKLEKIEVADPIVPNKNSAPAKQETAFDQYDEKGGTNYIAKWMGDDETTVTSRTGRKSFKGNVEQTAVLSAPLAAEPAAMPVELTPPPQAIIPTAPSEAPAVVVPAAVEVAPEPEIRPTPRNGKGNGVIIPISELSPSAGGAEIAANDVQPTLSSVPKKSRQFEVIKGEKDLLLQQLQHQHKSSMEEKKQLDAEPSDLTLPDVEDTLEEIHSALESPQPIAAVQ